MDQPLHDLLARFFAEHPDVRQEDLAALSGVSTKTISTLRNNPEHSASHKTEHFLREAMWRIADTPNVIALTKELRDLSPDEIEEIQEHVRDIRARRRG